MGRKKRRRVYGLTETEHGTRSRAELKELRRLQKTLRSKLKSPPDCVHAAHLVFMIAEKTGAYKGDRRDSRGRNSPGAEESSLNMTERFVKVCVLHSKTRGRG